MSAPPSGIQAWAASADDEKFGPMKRAAVWCVKYDVHDGRHKPRQQVESVIPDPRNRDGVFATEDDICQCGDDVAKAGYSDAYTSGKCIQLPHSPAARLQIIQYNQGKAAVSASHPEVFVNEVVATGVAGNTLNLFFAA